MLFLVVDDDALSRELLTLLLGVEGYEIEAVVSGEAAVARIVSSACGVEDRLPLPNVILTDIQMPGLAGDALASALREQLARGAKTADRTLLLAMSGSRPAASALKGFDGFLLKPFQVSELRSEIERASRASETGAFVGGPEGPAREATSAGGASPDGLPDALDEEIYGKMRDLMPAAQLGQMYALCLDDARKRVAHMQALAAAGDDAGYRKEAHAVKGGSGMIGASELYALAAAAEQEGIPPSGDGAGTSGVTAKLVQLSRACGRLERILQERTRR